MKNVNSYKIHSLLENINSSILFEELSSYMYLTSDEFRRLIFEASDEYCDNTDDYHCSSILLLYDIDLHQEQQHNYVSANYSYPTYFEDVIEFSDPYGNLIVSTVAYTNIRIKVYDDTNTDLSIRVSVNNVEYESDANNQTPYLIIEDDKLTVETFSDLLDLMYNTYYSVNDIVNTTKSGDVKYLPFNKK